MAMTKKDFEALATALGKARPPDDSRTPGMDQFERDLLKAKDTQWVDTVTHVCDALQEINPRFDRDRFTDWINARK